MTTQRDVRSLGEDIQKMILGGYTSFIEGISLQDEDLAWELAEKYADQLRVMVRTTFADLAADASEGLRKPKRRRRKKSTRSTAPVIDEATQVSSGIMPMGAEELPDNPESLLQQINDPEQVDFAIESAMRGQNVTNRANESAGGATRSRFDTNNPTMKRID